MCGVDGSCSRRDFLEQGTLAAVSAMLAAACGGRIEFGSVSGPSGGTGTLTIQLTDYPALNTVGGIAVISGASTPIAAVRLDPTTYVVLSLVCPHQGTTVGRSGAGFRCPNHGATWNGSGIWTGGQRTSGLTRLTTTLDETAGTLTIEGVPSRRGRGDDDDG